MRSSGTSWPTSMILFAAVPNGVPALTAARSMSPVEIFGMPNLAAMKAACVPLPAPGPPKSMSRMVSLCLGDISVARALMDQLLDDARIRQSRYVAQLAVFTGGDLAKNPADDLSGTRLRKGRRPLNGVGRGNGTDLLADPVTQPGTQGLGGLHSGDQSDVRVDPLALDVVWKSNDGGLRHLRMSDQGTFNFRGTQPVSGHIDDVVDTTRDPVIAIGIAARAITGEIHTSKGLEVCVDEALVVAINRAHLSGPAIQQHQISLARALKDATLVVDYGRLHAKERHGGRSWLEVGGAR